MTYVATLFLLCRFEAIFETVYLACFALALSADNLGAQSLLLIHELLTPTLVLRRILIDRLVVTQSREPLIGDPAQIATLIKTDLVLLSRLD